MSSNNHSISDPVELSNTNNEMTLLLLQWRTLQQTKRHSTAASSPVEQSPVSPSQRIGSSIPLLLQRRRQFREQSGTRTHHHKLLRSDLVKLMDEALSISTEITRVVPLEPTSAVVASNDGNHKGRIETHETNSINADNA